MQGGGAASSSPALAGGSPDNRLGPDPDPITSAPFIKMLQGQEPGDGRGRSIFLQVLGQLHPPQTPVQGPDWRRPGLERRLSPPLSKTPDSAEKEAAGEATVWIHGTVAFPSVASGCAGLCAQGPRARVASPLGRTLAQTTLKDRTLPATHPGSQPTLPAQRRSVAPAPPDLSLDTANCPTMSPALWSPFRPLGSVGASGLSRPDSFGLSALVSSAAPSLRPARLPPAPWPPFTQSTNTYAHGTCQAPTEGTRQ